MERSLKPYIGRRRTEPKGTKGSSRKAPKRERDLPARQSSLYASPSLASKKLPFQQKKENPQASMLKGSLIENGGYLLSHFYAVPSAWLGLTSLFGMGRGGTPTL